MFPVFPSIKHASLWCRMNGDDFFLFKTSGFLKIDPQKIILRRFEKYFQKKKIENLDFKNFRSHFFLRKGIFPMEIQCKIDGVDPASENFNIVREIFGRVSKLHAVGPPELRDANFLMI